MAQSESIELIAKALIAAQSEIEGPAKNKINPHFKNKYADLDGCIEAIVPILNKHGIFVTQPLGTGAKGPTIATKLIHVSGQWIESGPLEMPSAKQDAQGYGGAITYGRRYSLLAALSVCAEEDDDGETASRPAPQRQQQSAPAKQSAPQESAHPSQPQGGVHFDGIDAVDAKYAGRGVCPRGNLTDYVYRALKGQFGPQMEAWPDEAAEEIRKTISRWKKAQPALQQTPAATGN